MPERGFYHPTIGYFQEVTQEGDPDPERPEGTREVPLPPGPEGWAFDPETDTWVEAPPEPLAIPHIVPKLAMVRAMRLLRMDGMPAATGDQRVWDVVQGALAQSSTEVQEDWDLLSQVPRDEPLMLGFAANLPFPEGVDADAMIDMVNVLADMIDRDVPQTNIEQVVGLVSGIVSGPDAVVGGGDLTGSHAEQVRPLFRP